MRQLRSRVILANAIAAFGLLAFAGFAQAQTVILGPGLGELQAEPAACLAEPGGCGAVTTVPATPSQTSVSPIDGTVVRWSLEGASETPGFVLDVMRLNTDGTWTVTASSAAVTPHPGAQTFATALPIRAGEYVGGVTPNGGSTGVLKDNTATFAVFLPALSVGQPGEKSAEPTTNAAAFQAVVETPALAPPLVPTPIAAPTPVTPTCTVPKLSGKMLKAAKKAIRSKACTVGLVSTKDGVKAASGQVVKQSPKPGSVVPLHTGVSVKVG